jgi:hypothetical protein
VSADTVPEDRAVIDRIVDGNTAVLLVGPGEREAHVPADALPDGVGDGTWLRIDPETDPVEVLGVDRELTDRRAADISTRMERIRQERHGGRFDR